MNDIKRKLMQHMKMERVESEFDCYRIGFRRYVLFYDELITKENQQQLLHTMDRTCNPPAFSDDPKSIIVIAKTKEQFQESELAFINDVFTFYIFFLINEENDEMYYYDRSAFLIINSRKHVRKIRNILRNERKEK